MNNKELRKMGYACLGLTFLGFVLACFVSDIIAGILVLIMGAGLTGIFYATTRKRYSELQKLNTYLSAILAGDYSLELEKNEEGELSILQNNLYKTTILLRTQNEKLKADQAYLADAMADISHQLKTPLTSMMVMNDLLEMEENVDKRKEFLDIQGKQLDKMSWLVQNLLKLSKLDAGTVEMKREMISLNQLISQTMDPFSISMELEGKEFLYEHEEKDIELLLDRNWTLEALRNIVKNCFEHMEEGGILKVRTSDNSLYAEIIIEDDGSGIDPEDLPHIFERFYRGKGASSESVGIGLALARTILEKEKGEISVSSEKGRGSCFTIRFYKSII